MNVSKDKKPLKDVDVRTRIQFLQIFGWFYIPSFILAVLITKSFLSGIFLAFVLDIILSLIVLYIVDMSSGGFSNFIYGTGKKTITAHERLDADMQQATYFKNNKNYEKAKEIIDQVLEKEPDYAEALFLKSKIMYEGFGDIEEAKKLLNEIFKIGPEKAPTIHNWALYFNKELYRKKEADQN